MANLVAILPFIIAGLLPGEPAYVIARRAVGSKLNQELRGE
jgi:hypothetical protein